MNRVWSALRWLSLVVLGVGMFAAGAILGEDRGDLIIALFVVGFILLVLLVENHRNNRSGKPTEDKGEEQK